MKRIIALGSALSMLLSVGAYAAVTDNEDMTVSISEETKKADSMMEVDVLLPGYGLSDLMTAQKSELLNILAYSEQAVTDSEGKLEVTFKLRGDSPSGSYTFVINGKDYQKEITQFILNDELSASAMQAIGDALTGGGDDQAKIDVIAAAISTQTAEYGIDQTGYVKDFTPDAWTKAAKLSYDYMKSNSITSVDTASASRIFNKAVAIVALENKRVGNIITDGKLFDLESGELKEWYTKKYVTEATGKRMAERLQSKEFSSFERFDSALTEAFVLSVIENPDGSGNTKEVMQAFAKYIGAGGSGSDKRYAFVSDKVWDSYGSLKTAFDGYTEEVKGDDKPSGRPSGSGAGGSGGRIPTTSVTVDPSDNNKAPQTDKNIYPLTIFEDLESVAWAEDAIVTLAERGIVNGVTDKEFAPNDFITREEFSAMLVRAFIPDVQAVEIGFSDTLKSEWYYESVAKAYGAGIIKGESDDVFGIGKNITRQDMAVMLHRVGEYVKLAIPTGEESFSFTDDADISDYARNAVYALHEAKIINGVTEAEFAPLENATRAQAAKMIYGLLEL